MKLILIFSLIFSTSAIAEDTFDKNSKLLEDKTYLCATEETSGYDYKNGRWIRERFTPDARFLIKYKATKWSVYEYETELEYETCEPPTDGTLTCKTSGDFIMNINTMKFSVTNTAPYVHNTRKNRDSVVLILGTCVSM